MSSAQFNIAMVVKADVAQGKANLTDFEASLRSTSAQAGKTGQAAATTADYMTQLAAATSKAALTQKELAAAQRATQASIAPSLVAPLANLQQSAAPVTAFWKSSETAARSLQGAVAGLNVTIGQQADDFLKASQAGAAWQRSLDDIRASFNPLYAASRQYEQQLDRIAEAERLGAISAREAAAARDRAATILAPTAGGVSAAAGVNSGYTANVAAQGFDIGVTAAMGMNPMMIGLQQGTQLVQVMQQMGGGKQALAGIAQGFLSILNPMSLATVGIVAFGALGIQALMNLLPETKTTEEVLSELADSVSRVKDTAAAARRSMADLGKEFGSAAGDAKELLALMAEIEMRAATKKADSALENVYSELGGAWNYSGGRRDYLQRMLGERSIAGRVMATPGNSPQTFRVDSALEDLDKARETGDLDKQTAAATKLVKVFDDAAKASGKVTDEENTALQQLGDLVTNLQRIKALKENAAGKAEAQEIVQDLGKQVDLQRTILQYGQDSAQVRAVENRQERENLALKLEKLGLSRQDADWQRAMGALTDLQHQHELAALDLKRQWFQDQDDKIAAIRRETALIGASASEQIRINALAEAEVDIRKRKLGVIEAVLVRMRAMATAQAEIDQARARALKDLSDAQTSEMFEAAISGTRDPYARAELEAQQEYARQIAAGAEQDIAAGNAMLVKARALRELQVSQNDYLRSQDETLAKMRLELSLVGQTAQVRARVLALAQAERDIQTQGLQGDRAEQVRRQAVAQAEMASTIEAQADAWQRVQSAGEAAIDGVLDKLRGGDIEGAMTEMLGEIEKGFFDLAIRNPLKNALLGTNLGTWQDVGGWSGIWGRLTGANPVDEGQLARDSVLPLQTMTVTAGSVILQGHLSGIPALTGAANTNGAPMSFAGGLTGSPDIQSQVWQFFAGKGLAPHQIAGIMGNIAGESGFNPLAVGDDGQAFGLMQWNDRKGKLFDFIGGKQNLGDVQKQLEFAWHELMTSENPAYQRLMASNDVQGATNAWMRGFERPSDQAMIDSWGVRLGAANESLAKFSTSTQTATGDLGTLGNGFGVFGQALQGLASGGTQGGISALLGGLGQMAAGWLGIPGFASGTDHFAGGWRIVGENGPELEATGASRIFNAAQTREILTSRAPAMTTANSSSAPVVNVTPTIVNDTGRPWKVEEQETTDARGQRQKKFVMSELVSEGLGTSGGAAAKTLASGYAVRRATRVRP